MFHAKERPMKRFLPYFFPVLAVILFGVSVYIWANDPAFPNVSCSRYGNSLKFRVPVRCYEYWGMK